MMLKVGTYNIQHGKSHRIYLEEKREVIDLSLFSDMIKEKGLDVCALNEMRNQEMTEGLCNQARVIGEALGYEWYFARAIDIRGGEYGNALVSRYPIRKVVTYPIAVPKAERTTREYFEDRVLLSADIDVEGKIFTVMSCHFGLAKSEQEKAVEIIREAVRKNPYPVVLLGDFNVTPDSDIYAALAELLTDAEAKHSGKQFTFPSHRPDRTIDYIFTYGNCRAENFSVAPEVRSDHLMVYTDLSLH